MDSQSHTLHMLFFPLMAQGHILPMIDMAKLFAARGVKSTILTTPGNATVVRQSIDTANAAGYLHPVQLYLIPFPSVDGLPQGCENLSSVPAGLHGHFFGALGGLRDSFDSALRHLLPDCVISDVFLPWTADAAAEFGIPRLVFHTSNYFVQCAIDSAQRCKPREILSDGDDSFVLPGLPHRIEMRRSMIADIRKVPFFMEMVKMMIESESKTYGAVMNSFYELEPEYADYYRNAMGRRAWSLGPLLLLSNQDTVGKSERGNDSSIDNDLCLKWLHDRAAQSVVYICFGSQFDVSTKQLREIGLGLEASNRPFIWVVRKDGEEWMPEGFEERIEGKGLIIKGWAPQLLILSHGSVGGFMTHCGSNSCMEGISAGLPLVTWPLFGDHFYIERFIVDVLDIGVAVGMEANSPNPEENVVIVEAAKIEAAINELMGDGEEAKKRRRRARELRESARKAVEKGGSSYNDTNRLIAELMEMKSAV